MVAPTLVVTLTATGPPNPYMAYESGTVDAIWLMGALMTPVRIASSAAARISDPMVSPIDPDEAIYSVTISGNTTIRRVNLVTDVSTDIVSLTGSSHNPMQYWNPNGTQIVYRRATGAPATSNEVWEIRRVDRDGTGDTLLFTYTPVPGTFQEALTCPCYSPSGSYIAYGKGRAGVADQVWIMNSDGTGSALAASTGGDVTGLQWTTPYTYLSWQHNADVLGWMDMQAGSADSSVWRKVNADGTGLTTLLTTAHVLGKVQWQGSGRFCWLPDDTAMVSFRVDGSTDPRWRLAKIDSGGAGSSFISSHFSYGTFTGNPFGQDGHNLAPLIFRNGDGRIYWSPGISTGVTINNDVVSVLPDGTGLRTDDDGTVTPAHGMYGFSGIVT